MRRKIIIRISKENLPKPRIPVYKMKKGGAHKSRKEKLEGRQKAKEELRKIVKSRT